jgi:hypothetical protein
MAKLKYIGNGAALIAVPARDLTEEEVKKFDVDALLKSGLYEKEKENKPAPKAKAQKEGE